MSKKFIVLDVEGMSSYKPYNIGYVVTNKKGEIFAERSYALPNSIWENLENCFAAREMTHKNIQEILADYGTGDARKYDYISDVDMITQLEKDVKDFNVKRIWAYNCTFDENAINRLFNRNGRPLLEIEWCDIWSAILYTKLLCKKYIDFCYDNNFLTDKGNIKTSAEVVYRYLTKNTEFEEEHTGLADVHIERQILMKAFKTKKKMVKKHPTPAWKVLKEFAKSIYPDI